LTKELITVSSTALIASWRHLLKLAKMSKSYFKQ
jgi:hypothetical protein